MKTKSTLLFCIICCLVATNMFNASAQSFTFTSSAESVEFTVDEAAKEIKIDWGNGKQLTVNVNKSPLCKSTADYSPGEPVTVYYDIKKPVSNLKINGQELTNLDVSNSGDYLKNLNCSVNKLTVLNLSLNTKLKELDCSANELDSLNISNSVELKDLNCSANKLKALDISINGKFHSLNCSMNNLCLKTLPLDTLLSDTVSLDANETPKKSYIYAPQQNVKVQYDKSSNTINLSTQREVTFDKLYSTVYTWYKIGDAEPLVIENTSYSNNDGVFVFTTLPTDSIYCTMSNTLFSQFIGEDILRTENIWLDATVGVETPEATTSISCYPNPMVDVLHIKTTDTTTPTVKIYNINGVLTLQDKSNNIDVSKLSQGIYIVEVNGQKIKVIKK